MNNSWWVQKKTILLQLDVLQIDIWLMKGKHALFAVLVM
jgi:hypothetical protein